MKSTLLILILGFTIGLKAQNLTKSDFQNTEWFTNNDNRIFYEADTIKLMKINKLDTENLELNRRYLSLHRNQNNNIIEFSFKKSNNLTVKDLNIEQWSTSKVKGKWKYEFDSKNQTLKFNLNGILHSTFKILSDKYERMNWVTKKNKVLKASKVELKILSFVRVEK